MIKLIIFYAAILVWIKFRSDKAGDKLVKLLRNLEEIIYD